MDIHGISMDIRKDPRTSMDILGSPWPSMGIHGSEVGGLLRPGNLNGSCVRDPVAGLFIVISPPVRCCACALWVWCSTLFCENKLKVVLRDDGASLVLSAWVLKGIERMSFVLRWTFGFRWFLWCR